MSSNNDTNRRRTKSTTQLQTNNGKLRPQSVANRRPTPVSIPSGSAGRRISSCSAPPHELALAACNETKSYDDLAVNSGFQRVRSFATKAGTVVNRGDSFRIRKVANKSDLEIDLEKRDSLEAFDKRAVGRNSKSNLRHGEDGSEAQNAIGRGRIMNSRQKKSDEIEVQTNRRSLPDQHRQQPGSVAKTDEESTSSVYNILVLGSPGVGKTTLVQQLMTSEYLANKETCYDEETGDQTVTVQMDEEESTLRFQKMPAIRLPGSSDGTGSEKGARKGDEAKSDPTGTRGGIPEIQHVCIGRDGKPAGDGFLVVYSVTDRSSFRYAQTCLQELRPAKRQNVVILVANKNDLVRNRIISETEGIKMASKKHCKFIEVSSLLDHRMDELLVGIVRQIRLRQTTFRPEVMIGSRDQSSLRSRLSETIQSIFSKFLKRNTMRPAYGKCDDLMTP